MSCHVISLDNVKKVVGDKAKLFWLLTAVAVTMDYVSMVKGAHEHSNNNGSTFQTEIGDWRDVVGWVVWCVIQGSSPEE